MDSRARALIDRLGRMKSERSLWESHWTEIARVMSPFRDDFLSQRTPGEKRMEHILDGTPGIAGENLSSALWGMMTNSANAWFTLKAEDEALNEDHAVKLWLDDAGRRLYGAFASGGQRFYTRVVDLFSDLVHFGTSVFYVDEVVGRRELHFSCRHLAECYIAENQLEQVDTVFRCYRWSARQAVQQWGERVSAKVREAAEKRPEDRFEFLHAVLPAKDYDGKSSRLPVASVYLCVDDGHIIDESGYYELPYQVPRWSQRSRSVYGDSPAMLALADAKMLQRMSAATITAAEKAVDPPLLTSDENVGKGIRIKRGKLIPGSLDAEGRPKYAPLQSGGQIGLGLEIEEQRRNAVREAFFASLLMLVNQPGRTATEVLALQEEKMRLMGPHLGRVQSEFLDPLIGRVFNILLRAGGLPPPPPVMLEAGANLMVEYVSPAARQQRAGEAMAIVRTLEVVAPMASVDPSIMDNFDGDEVAQIAGNSFGLPAKALRSPEAVAQIRQQRAQQQALAAAAEAAPKVAGAMKQGAEAQQIAQGQQGRAA